MIAIATQVPTIGQPWPEQGGIYIGARLVKKGILHVIIPGGVEYDIKASYNNAAERIAAKGKINGFSDWRHGSQEDVMLAYINARDMFPHEGHNSIQITATPCGSFIAWVVDFEHGGVGWRARDDEFRVRPFRSVIHSAL